LTTVKGPKSGRRILNASGWLLVPKTVSAVLSLVYLALAAKMLGAAGFGMFMLIFSFAQTVSGFSTFQTWQILIRYGTGLVHDNKVDQQSQLVWICLLLDLAGITLALVLATIGVGFLGANQGWTASQEWMTIAFTVLLVLASRSTPTGILRINDRFRTAALPDILVPVIRLAGTLVLAFTQASVDAFILVWLLSELIPALVVWLVVLANLKLPLGWRNLKALRGHRDVFPGIGKFALSSNLGASLKLTNQQMVAVVVGFQSGATIAGFFRLGHQLGQVVARIGDALTVAIFTEYARVAHVDNKGDAKALLSRTTKMTIFGASLMLLFIAIAGEPLIIAIFGHEFAPAFPFVLLLGGAAAVQFAAATLEPALLVAGYAGRVMWCNLVGAITVAILLYLLLPGYTATGAAWAVLGSAIANAAALAFAYRRYISRET
jgi:O-antigen/teichoic acid export membrane protein